MKLWVIKDTMIPILMLVVYQFVLNHYGLQKYIEDGSRYCSKEQHRNGIVKYLYEYKLCQYLCNFFAANREGILGCIGYTCLFVISEVIAKLCIWSSLQNDTTTNESTEEKKIENEKKYGHLVGTKLFTASFILWCILFFLEYILHIPTSRRSTNATFVVWALAQNVLGLFLTWLAFFLCEEEGNIEKHDDGKYRSKESISKTNVSVSSSSPMIFEAANHHGMTIFIIANLLTGVVNLSINTLEVSDGCAVIVILAYLVSVGSTALLLDWCGGVSGGIKSVVSFLSRKKSKEKSE